MTKNDLLAEIVKTYHEIEDQLMVIGTTGKNAGGVYCIKIE